MTNRKTIEKMILRPLMEDETATKCEVSLDYIANPKLLEKVKERTLDIKADAVQNISILEQHLEERPYSLVPSILYTAWSDRAAAFLQEGNIILLMNSSPASLILPATFWSFFHASEDYYQRWPYGIFIRGIRLLALGIALLLPCLYIAITNYHTESIPTDLLLAIAATRKTLPLPVFIEVLLMEIAFELLREAGIYRLWYSK